MEKKWSDLSPDEKREERFKRWLSHEDISFNTLMPKGSINKG
jgi:hypothetical protein